METNLTKEQLQQLLGDRFERTFTAVRAEIDEEARTVPLAFSSEEPYQRWFGIEILGHEKDQVEMDFMAGGTAPLLVGHDHDDIVGVIEKAWIAQDHKGRAIVRFGRSTRAEEIFQDVKDGIRRNVSVGYQIKEMKLIESDEEKGDTYMVTRWTPYEASLVSVPADATVGINRAGEQKTNTLFNGDFTMSDRKEVQEILALGKVHNYRDEAEKAVSEGWSLEKFRAWMLEEMGKRSSLRPIDNPDPGIGLTPREAKNFSFLKALRAQVTGDWHGAEFEKEVSDTAKKQAQKRGRDIRGLGIPYEVLSMKRDLTVGTDTAGGYMVGTDLLAGSFIDMLNNAIQVENLGATVLNGLIGDVAIPKNSAAATAYWVAENDNVTESQPTFAQVSLSPKSVGAMTDLSRKLLLQSSLDVENWIKQHLALQLAIAIDLAAINGSGTSNQPTGILNTTGIGDVAGGTNGAAPSWANIVDLEAAVAQDNAAFGSLGYLTNAAVISKLKQTEKSSNTAKFICEDNEKLNGYKLAMSNQVPSDLTKGSASTCSAIIFGNWTDLIIGTWGVLDINVDRSTHSASGGVRIVVFQDVDIAIRHAESFAAMQDVLTT